MVVEINRNIGSFPTNHGDAVDTNDQHLIVQVNQTRTAIESTANELRQMTDIYDMMKNRVADALSLADDTLSRYQPIQFDMREAESQNGRVDEVRNSPPPPPRGSDTQLGANIAALLFPGSDRLSRQSSHHSTYQSSEPPAYYETHKGPTPIGSVTGLQSPTQSLSSRHLNEEAADQATQRQIDENCLHLESEVDRLQSEREKRASDRVFEDRELERRLQRLHGRGSNAKTACNSGL